MEAEKQKKQKTGRKDEEKDLESTEYLEKKVEDPEFAGGRERKPKKKHKKDKKESKDKGDKQGVSSSEEDQEGNKIHSKLKEKLKKIEKEKGLEKLGTVIKDKDCKKKSKKEKNEEGEKASSSSEELDKKKKKKNKNREQELENAFVRESQNDSMKDDNQKKSKKERTKSEKMNISEKNDSEKDKESVKKDEKKHQKRKKEEPQENPQSAEMRKAQDEQESTRPSAAVGQGNQWATATFESDERRDKFMRLMGGFKKSSAGSSTSGSLAGRSSFSALSRDQEKKLNKGLEDQYDRAMEFRRGKRGMGLGYSADNDPTAKKFHIDKEASNSVKL